MTGETQVQTKLDRRDWRDDPRVRQVFDHGDPFYVAVSTASGVHVVPVNYTRQGRQVWFCTMRRTVKARAIRHRPAVGGLLRFGDRAVMLTGRAKLVDVPTGRGLSPKRLLKLPPAMADYALRNAKVLAGSAWDRPTPTWPLLNMIPVRIRVERVALVERGEVIAAWGDWARRAPGGPGVVAPSLPPALERLPPGLRRLVDDPARPAVLGWESDCGPVAIPAQWRGAMGLVETGLSPLTLAGVTSGTTACAVVDRYGSRLRDHEGVLMAGRGQLEVAGGMARVAIALRRLTYWHMDERETVWRGPEKGGADGLVAAAARRGDR